MKDIKINPQDVPGKINTDLLTNELASKLGVPREQVGISTETDVESGAIYVTAHVPDNAKSADVVNVARNHAPEKNDEEEIAEKEVEEFRNHPVIAEILNRLAALEGGK